MASKVLVVSVVLLFSIAVVGAIPKYVLRSENQDDVNCTDVDYQFNHGNVCTLYQDIIKGSYLIKRYPNATEDFYHDVSQRLTAFCASQCKRIVIARANCHKNTHAVTAINYGTCGKINQEFCYVHHLRGTAADTIVTFFKLTMICPGDSANNGRLYCVEGVCQRNVTQWANYMGCCASSLLRPIFNLTSCGITDTTPCSSGTVAISSSVFIMIAIAIIQMYWM